MRWYLNEGQPESDAGRTLAAWCLFAFTLGAIAGAALF